jgi:membrane protein CcdC involved in cytochrome C biogenesis
MLRGIILFFAPNMEFGWRQFMETSIVSLLFSLELLKTYLLYALTDPLYKTKPKAAAAVKE